MAADLGKFLGREQHERGEDVLDNEPVDPSGPLEVPLVCCTLIAAKCLIVLYDSSSR